jgi:tripartite-type tricarboxylate transporter receptor subunit TctC
MRKKILAITLSLVFVIVIVTSCSASSKSSAEVWPNKTITFQTAGAGGDMDFLARLLATKMKADLGPNVVVVNNDNGVIAARNTLSAPKDGYTILMGKTNISVQKTQGSLEGFDFDSFDYLGMLVANPAQCIAVKPSLGVKTLPELIELSKQNPGELRITDNIGSNTQVVCKMLEEYGAMFTQVDVGGSSAKMTAFLGDHCEVLVTLYSSMKEYADAGELLVLCTISEERNALFPEVPTAREQGVDITFGTSLYAAMPKGVDPAIVSKASTYLENIIKNDEKFAEDASTAQQLVPLWKSGPDTLKHLNDEYEMLYDIGFATR